MRPTSTSPQPQLTCIWHSPEYLLPTLVGTANGLENEPNEKLTLACQIGSESSLAATEIKVVLGLMAHERIEGAKRVVVFGTIIACFARLHVQDGLCGFQGNRKLLGHVHRIEAGLTSPKNLPQQGRRGCLLWSAVFRAVGAKEGRSRVLAS